MKIKSIFGIFTLLMVPFLLRSSLRATQDARPTPDDAAIMAAAVDKMLRPELVKLESRKPNAQLVIFDRTKALCRSDDTAIRRAMGCLGPGFTSKVEKISTVFKNDLSDQTRTEIVAAFLERNKTNVMISPKSIPAATLASPAEIVGKYDEKSDRGEPHATLSMPAISTNGTAIIFVSYWCGNMCATAG